MKMLPFATVAIIVFTCFTFIIEKQHTRKHAVVMTAASAAADGKQSIVLCEQSGHRILIVDVTSKSTVWEWNARASNVLPGHVQWFDFPDEAKPVYNNGYILMTASGGGVALIRISDKRTVFYAYAGGNPHSAEILPDGNIVSSSSTGNFLTLFRVDTANFPDNITAKKYPISDGHNVVWDRKRQVLWAGSDRQLRSYKYNNNCTQPDLILSDSVLLPGNLHDLFPAYDEDALWLTTNTKVFKLDLVTKKCEVPNVKQPSNIKSVSSGPAGFPIVIIYPKEKWWTDEVISTTGQPVFREHGLKIYKARWFLSNQFSYPADHKIKVCL